MVKADLLDILKKARENALDWYCDEEGDDPCWVCVDHLFPGDSMATQVIFEKFSDGSVVVIPQQGNCGVPQENFVKLSLECQQELQELFGLGFEYLTG